MTATCDDLDALGDRFPDRVARVAELVDAAVPPRAIADHCKPDGPWQRLLPGVLLLSPAPATRRQRLRAALTYAGPTGVLTGVEALREHGVPVPEPNSVHVLVEHRRRAGNRGFVTLERTTRLPAAVDRAGLPVAPVERAVLDAARIEPDEHRVRQLLAQVVGSGRCSVDDLRAELDAGSQRGSAVPRRLVEEVDLELSTFGHHRARQVLRDVPVPAPWWRVPLCDQRGRELAVADAWWDDIALAWIIEDAARPRGFGPLADAGAMVVRTHYERLVDEPAAVATELSLAFLHAARRPRPPVRVAARRAA